MTLAQPAALRRGNDFQNRVQADWKENAQGAAEDKICCEESTPLLPRGRAQRIRRGRMDIFVAEDERMVSIVEIKATDWDRIKHVGRVLAAHRRQVWKYVEKYLEGERLEVCAGIIYPTAPSSDDLTRRIESYLNAYGLQVVWYDDD